MFMSRPFFPTRVSLLACLGLTIAASPASAWGPSGHRMVAETAALLLEDDAHPWAFLLTRNRVELGFYSIVPDASFRNDDGAKGAVEGPTHFFKIDALLGGKSGAEARARIDGLPCDEAGLRAAAGIADAEQYRKDVGTAPARIAQLLAAARAEFDQVQQPEGGYKPGRTATGDAAHIFRGLYHLGLASHYTGDAGMPYHAHADWNGFATRQGGIHFYFEFDCVNALEPSLAPEVLAAARAGRKAWLAEWNAGGADFRTALRRVYLDSHQAVERVARVDQEKVMLEPSPADGKGFAKRRPAREGCPAFRSLLVERLARAAVLTALAWDSALPRGTDLSKAATLQYADMVLDPEFLVPLEDVGCAVAPPTQGGTRP